MNHISKIVTILACAAAIYLWIVKGFWYIAAFIAILHFTEIFIKGIPVGEKFGKSKIHSAIMTMIFGFTWWLPIQQELANKDK